MIKVLIVDDSVARQEQALGRSLLARLRGLGNVDILNGYTYGKGAVADSGYDMLAFHRTFLIDNGWLADVVAEAVASAKWLVLFGGTISENMFFARGRVLRMSSADFYSESAVAFFESLSDVPPEGADNLLLKLLYGRKWHAVSDLRERYAGWKSAQETAAAGRLAAGSAREDAGRMFRILVLENSNLPAFLSVSGRVGNIELTVAGRFSPDEGEIIGNYDSFTDGRLAEIFSSGTNFDAVVLPYTFSAFNPLEYTGIRAAMHIRLTPSWRHQCAPLIFVGPLLPAEIARHVPAASFLFTGNVFCLEDASADSIFQTVASAETDDEPDEWFERFLETVKVEPPFDYEQPHSLSNEWALLRWREMFGWTDEEGACFGSVSCMLYFKYLMATSGKRSRFRRKHLKSARISGIKDKSFVLIDDSADRGWAALLEEIIVRESGGRLYCFDSFECAEGRQPDTGILERAELLAEIERYLSLPEIRAADGYIVDLRLCREDVECEPDSLTGLSVIRRLKEINRCNQIVVFTASEQIWSLKEKLAATGLAGLVLKEDPEDNFSRGESYGMFLDFSQALSKAARLSYLKDFAAAVDRYAPVLHEEETALLDDFVDLMLIDMPEYTLKPAVLNLVVFLEGYLKRKFRVDDDGFIYSRPGNRCLADYGGRLLFRFERNGGYSNVSDMKVLEEGERPPRGWAAPKDSDIRDMIAPLYFYYGISETDCRRVITMKKLRNTRIAHGGGDLRISAEELAAVCRGVIFRILDMDSGG